MWLAAVRRASYVQPHAKYEYGQCFNEAAA